MSSCSIMAAHSQKGHKNSEILANTAEKKEYFRISTVVYNMIKLNFYNLAVQYVILTAYV